MPDAENRTGRKATANGLTADRCAGIAVDRGNAVLLLHELRHALDRLLANSEETVIDLARLPLGPADEVALDAMLGDGEIAATVRVMGDSSVEETAFPGVWRITHRDDGGRVQARFLSVCWIPEILRAQRIDVEDGVRRLTEMVESDQ
ncbi:MAG: hydrogenase expression/formation C-terminal domain-containing protein [Pseudomonadota bacterium]|nr:hydrogenase expression/formation C-terminal domain-containing protein [Pseudomonadota bacterium]